MTLGASPIGSSPISSGDSSSTIVSFSASIVGTSSGSANFGAEASFSASITGTSSGSADIGAESAFSTNIDGTSLLTASFGALSEFSASIVGFSSMTASFVGEIPSSDLGGGGILLFEEEKKEPFNLRPLDFYARLKGKSKLKATFSASRIEYAAPQITLKFAAEVRNRSDFKAEIKKLASFTSNSKNKSSSKASFYNTINAVTIKDCNKSVVKAAFNPFNTYEDEEEELILLLTIDS